MRSQRTHKKKRGEPLRYWFDFDAFSDLCWSLEQAQFKPLEEALQGALNPYQRERAADLRRALAASVARIDLILQQPPAADART